MSNLLGDLVEGVEHHDGEEEAGGGGHAVNGRRGPDGDDDAEHRFDWKIFRFF